VAQYAVDVIRLLPGVAPTLEFFPMSDPSVVLDALAPAVGIRRFLVEFLVYPIAQPSMNVNLGIMVDAPDAATAITAAMATLTSRVVDFGVDNDALPMYTTDVTDLTNATLPGPTTVSGGLTTVVVNAASVDLAGIAAMIAESPLTPSSSLGAPVAIRALSTSC